MYYVRDKMSILASAMASGQKGLTSSHPTPSPFLRSFHRIRDIPFGAICHVLDACKRIQKLNLSRLQLAADFLVCSPNAPRSLVPPTCQADTSSHGKRKKVYVSDVPKSWSWESGELLPISADHILTSILSLPSLESLKAKNCLWLTTARVERMMKEVGDRLLWVDFRESGMQKDVRWAVKGTRAEVEKIVAEVIRNTRGEGVGV